MKAAVRDEYGPPEVVNVVDVPTPVPADEEVLVRVHAASVNLGDWELLTGHPRFISMLGDLFVGKSRVSLPEPTGGTTIRRPKIRILGCDAAGIVESVGAKVTQFRPGEEIFGLCGFGAFAEYLCVPETSPFVPKPAGLSFEQAASLPQATFIALQGMRDKAQVEAGRKVLINGAGGGAGTFAVQLAKLYGAEVTGVDGPTKLDLLRSLDADHVIDYTREDFTRNGERYDVILDLAAHRSIFESRRSLAEGGVYLMAGGSGKATWQSAFLGPFLGGRGKVKFLMAADRRDDLNHMAGLVESGEVVPVIDRCYPLADIREALRCVGEKQSLGKAIVTVAAR